MPRLFTDSRRMPSAFNSRDLSEICPPETTSLFTVGVRNIHLQWLISHRLHALVSGHGIQLECPHHTESDGYDECRKFFDFFHIIFTYSCRSVWLQWQANYRQCELHHLSGTTSRWPRFQVLHKCLVEELPRECKLFVSITKYAFMKFWLMGAGVVGCMSHWDHPWWVYSVSFARAPKTWFSKIWPTTSAMNLMQSAALHPNLDGAEKVCRK